MIRFTDRVAVDYPALLAHQDLVYHAPATEGIEGLAIGNGDIGAQVWTPADRIQIAINKTDLWDDGPDGPFASWADETEEENTTLRSGAGLTISNGMPTFDPVYLKDFEFRLGLHRAEVGLRSVASFASVTAEAFVAQTPAVLVLRYRDHTVEAVPRRFDLARWGSRSFAHWYRKITRHGDDLALGATECGCEGKFLWITQRLRRLDFAVVLGVDGPVSARRLHRRAGLLESAPMEDFAASLYVTVVTSEEAKDPLREAVSRVADASSQGLARIREGHRKQWAGFWQQSFVDLPPEQDYAENLWYLSAYYTASGSRGRSPLNHINGIYGWTGDIRPWAHYYHWNEQIHIWPLYASGHWDLASPYYRRRRDMLPHAISDAEELHQRSGAFYTDVSNRKGYQATDNGLRCNLTPGSQIAANFWRQYEYTGDLEFLREYAYPVILEVARFVLGSLTRRKDGKFTFVGTHAYEGNVLFEDTITDLAHARQIFKTFVAASSLLAQDRRLRRECAAALDNLVEYPVMTVPRDSYIAPESVMDLRPIRFRESPAGRPMQIWAVGRKVGGRGAGPEGITDGALMHEGMSDPIRQIWIMTSSNMAPVFPSEQVGLNERGTDDYELAVNTVNAFGRNDSAYSMWMVGQARLGLQRSLRESLANWPQLYQIGPQGFTHYELENHPNRRDTMALREVKVIGSSEGSDGETIHWPMRRAEHMSIEALPMIQFAINEMLLQSHSGVVRIFPAVPDDWTGTFRLHAAGGFVVTARRGPDGVEFVLIDSVLGSEWHSVNPWPGAAVLVYEYANHAWTQIGKGGGEYCDFPTVAHGTYAIIAEAQPLESFDPVVITDSPNIAPKPSGSVCLGLPRAY